MEVSKKFEEKVANVFPKRRGRRAKVFLYSALETLGRWLRGIRTSIKRLENEAVYLQNEIIRIMDNLGIDEYTFGYTRLQKVTRLQVINEESLEAVKKVIGKKRAEKWIQRVERVEYRFTPEALEEIRNNPELERKIVETIDAPEYIVITKFSKKKK